MKGKIFLYFNESLGDSVWNKVSKQNKTINDFATSAPIPSDSSWGNELIYESLRYKSQLSADAVADISGKDFLTLAGQMLEDNQRLEYFSTDSEYDRYPYCEQRHFAKGDLSGSFSGVKFRGSLEEVLQAYDDIIEHFGSLRVHMFSISCTKGFEGLTAEIQLEYSDYIVDKAYFTKIVNKHPDLRMVAVSIPEGKWENWFFFTSGGHSTSLKVEEIRYERTADSDYWYWAKSAYFDQDDWHFGDFVFFEKEKRADVFPNLFNWSETLEYPSSYWGAKPLWCRARNTKYNKKIILPNVAKYLGYNSFSDCYRLNEVIMPSITKIYDGAFLGCKSLKKLVVSEKLTHIGDEAFKECSSFEVEAPLGSYADQYFHFENESNTPDFVIKKGVLVKYIGESRTVSIPEGVTEIGKSAFEGNQRIWDVVVPASVTTIRQGAFCNCSNLDSVILPEGLKTIADDAFSQCKELRKINIPKSVTEIGEYAFYECTNLTAVTIPEGITTIACSVFACCKNLQEVILPESLTTIEYMSFSYCKSLSSIVIPANVTKIGEYAFSYCPKLAHITLLNDSVELDDGVFVGCRKLEDKNKLVIVQNILFGYSGQREHISIPEGVNALKDSAFSGCICLKVITLPKSVNVIGQLPYGVKLEVFAESYAEKYAKENKITFKIIEESNEQTTSVSEKAAILAGKTFVVTGYLFYYGDRDALKGVIEELGGKLTESVSKKTTALITNDPDSGTSKIKKAQELGIEIIKESEFIEQYLPKQYRPKYFTPLK